MKKCLLLFCLLAGLADVNAAYKKLYAVYLEDGTMVFFYGDEYQYTDNYVINWIGSQYENHKVRKVAFSESVSDYRPTSTSDWFKDFINLKEFEGLEYLNTSEVTDMSDMFAGCYHLESLSLNTFDTSKVTNMSGMFSSCFGLKSLDITRFDTSQVIYMYNMFESCMRLTSLDLRFFSMKSVQDVSRMFWQCDQLKTIYSTDDWSGLTGVNGADLLFDRCLSLVGGNGTTQSGLSNALAHLDKPGNPGYFTTPNQLPLTIDGVTITEPGPVKLPCIKSGTVTYSEDQYVGGYPELVLEDAVLRMEKDGIFAPDGVVLVLKGDNEISALGTAIFSCDVLPVGDGTLIINSDQGYGIRMASGLFSASEDDDVCVVLIEGATGAVRGQPRWSNYYKDYVWPSINPDKMYVGLATDGEHPVVSGISEISGTSTNFGQATTLFSYESYRMDKEQRAVVTDPSGNPVTKPFYIVPKEDIGNYGIYVGGEQLNYWNSENFNPMSLTEGRVKYVPNENELYLEDVRFDYPYEPTDDMYGLQCWMTPDIHVYVEGDCSLLGTLTDDFGYGLNFSADGSETDTRPYWAVEGTTVDKPSSLELSGEVYFQSTDYKGADAVLKDLDLTVTDRAYLWGEDDIDVHIDNCNVTLWNKKSPETTIVECLNGLTLYDCHFQTETFWNNGKGRVEDADGNGAKGLVVIARDGEVVGIERLKENEKRYGGDDGEHLSSDGEHQSAGKRGGLYDLSGRRIANAQFSTRPNDAPGNCQLSIVNCPLKKGVYIQGGKKVIITH